jgi:hypothetical protein
VLGDEVRIVEAKSTYTKVDMFDENFNLMPTLTDGQRANYPLINSGAGLVRLRTPIEGLDLAKLKTDTIQMELRIYRDKANLDDHPADKGEVFYTFRSGKAELVAGEGLAAGELLTARDVAALLPAARQYWRDAGLPTSSSTSPRSASTCFPRTWRQRGRWARRSLARRRRLGWFVDSTPGDAAEFTPTLSGAWTAPAGSVAAGKLDLLTVMIHEMGHVLGLDDVLRDDAAMSAYLRPGVRHLPSADDLGQWLATHSSTDIGEASTVFSAKIFVDRVDAPGAALDLLNAGVGGISHWNSLGAQANPTPDADGNLTSSKATTAKPS